MAQACKSNTWQAEVGRSTQGQPGLQCIQGQSDEILTQILNK